MFQEKTGFELGIIVLNNYSYSKYFGQHAVAVLYAGFPCLDNTPQWPTDVISLPPNI
jgi:hypothetical protein